MKSKRIWILVFGLLFILVASSFYLVAEYIHCDEIHGYRCRNDTSDGCEASRNQGCILKCTDGDGDIDCDIWPY